MNKPTDMRTIVIQVHDPAKFTALWATLCEAMCSSEEASQERGWEVTGASRNDEMSRVEYLESVLDEERIDYDK